MNRKLLNALISIITIASMVLALTSCTKKEETVIVEELVTPITEMGNVVDVTDLTEFTSEETTAPPETEAEETEESESEPEETEEADITEAANDDSNATSEESDLLDEDASYTSKDDVALYIYQYGKLPSNFMTKIEARELGWTGGSLENYAPGMCIGGDYFGNYEGLLPEKDGREYHECDIDTLGAKSRGAKRIIFSNDGLIYYTDDHYETFTLLYGEE